MPGKQTIIVECYECEASFSLTSAVNESLAFCPFCGTDLRVPFADTCSREEDADEVDDFMDEGGGDDY